jgi:two-component system, cell cycle response regulator
MLDDTHPMFLVASSSPRLVAAIQSSLAALGGLVRAASSADALFELINGASVPCLVMIDAELPGAPALGDQIGQMLAGLRAGPDDRRFPIALISDGGIPEWRDRLNEGIIDDLFPRELPPFHWRLRVEGMLRTFRYMRELEHLRETAHRDTDPLTGLSNRDALLSMLFRETDRVQRMNTPLSLMLFEVDDFAHWHARLGVAACDDLIRQLVGRVQRLLRSYDLFSRIGNAGFALGLPGCTPVNAVSLAERIRGEVLSVPFQAGRTAVRLTACFGIAASLGRSPLVVLREAERALQAAMTAGPEAIRTSRDCPRTEPPPEEFFSPVASKDRLTK